MREQGRHVEKDTGSKADSAVQDHGLRCRKQEVKNTVAAAIKLTEAE